MPMPMFFPVVDVYIYMWTMEESWEWSCVVIIVAFTISLLLLFNYSIIRMVKEFFFHTGQLHYKKLFYSYKRLDDALVILSSA